MYDGAAGRYLAGWLGAETRMLPTDGEWYTVSQAARELGLTPGTVRYLIAHGRIKARQITPRLNAVSAEEIARYRREHLGRQGWDKRRAPEYRPSKMAAWVKNYRARRKAATQELDKMPAEE
jgi:excisionase family DNA binding protein